MGKIYGCRKSADCAKRSADPNGEPPTGSVGPFCLAFSTTAVENRFDEKRKNLTFVRTFFSENGFFRIHLSAFLKRSQLFQQAVENCCGKVP